MIKSKLSNFLHYLNYLLVTYPTNYLSIYLYIYLSIYLSIYQVDCQWGGWGAWGQCSQSCGVGQRMRRREVKIEKANGGKY